MDKTERDKLEALAVEARGESWCLHPSGTSVWTGEDYEINTDKKSVVCQVPWPCGKEQVRRAKFIAGCSPHVVQELLEFYGLSDTRIEHGQEDSDEVCAVCNFATTEGHTHAECFANGKSVGAQDENITCSNQINEVLGLVSHGFFSESMKHVALLQEDAKVLASLANIWGAGMLTERQQQALRRVLGQIA